MLTEKYLLGLGFVYRPEVKDYTLELSERFIIRADVLSSRFSVYVQFNVVEDVVTCFDVVHMGYFDPIKLKKIIEAVKNLIKYERGIGAKLAKKEMGNVD